MDQKNSGLPIVGGNVFCAVYSEPKDEDYKGNPFIEALPPKLTREQAIEKLAYLPYYSIKERDLDAETRYDNVQRLFNYFEPLVRHLDLELRVSSIIRRGYVARNPLNPEEAARLNIDYHMRKCGAYDIPDQGFETSATSMTIIGISGMGKTSTLNRILSYYPQVIVHSEYRGIKLDRYQIVWLKLDCPFDGSIKGLCINFFQAVDDLLGTNYFRRFGNPRNSVDAMLPRMKQIALLYGLGLLAIDEIQHLSMANSGGSDKMLNFFVTLINTIGVPVILIGTPKALSVLQSQFRQARRGSGQGDMVWDRLENDEQWDLLLSGMWRYQWTQSQIPLTNELKDVFYDESQGIIDIAIKLYALAQWKAISFGEETITPDSVRMVAEESLQLVRPMLNALKSGDIKEISKYEDIRPINMEKHQKSYYTNLQSRFINTRQTERSKSPYDKQELAEQIILGLLRVGIEANVAEEATHKVIKAGGIEDITTATLLAHKMALQITDVPKITPKRTRKSKDAIDDPDDLRFIAIEGKKNQKSAYESLSEQDVMKNPVDEFIEV